MKIKDNKDVELVRGGKKLGILQSLLEISNCIYIHHN